jgi:hypothetical protein
MLYHIQPTPKGPPRQESAFDSPNRQKVLTKEDEEEETICIGPKKRPPCPSSLAGRPEPGTPSPEYAGTEMQQSQLRA